jgi:hypothetical protein
MSKSPEQLTNLDEKIKVQFLPYLNISLPLAHILSNPRRKTAKLIKKANRGF